MSVVETKDGASLNIFVKPNSPKFKIEVDGDEVVVYSTEEPVKGKVNKEIIMQKAFSRAYNDTLMWSTNHLVRQTPCKVDTTNGQYYLN